MLTGAVVPVFGRPFHQHKNISQHNITDNSDVLKTQQNPIMRQESQSSISTNISWNVSATNGNKTEVFPLSNVSTTNQNETEAFPLGEGNSTWLSGATSADAIAVMMVLPEIEPEKRSPKARLGVGCPLPTCLTANLGSFLQTGDEIAGQSTSDPFGNGKK